MPSEYSISQLLQIGKLSQVLSSVENQNKLLLKSGTIDPRLPISIYQVWKPLSLRYAANPNDTALRQIGEWLLQLCGPYALQAQNIINKLSGSLPVISGPTNQSVLVGATATFSVSVTSSTPYTIQWFSNGVLIPGATSTTYLLTNAQTSMSGNTYFVMATNSAGIVVSNQVTLTVTASILGYLYYSASDPGPTLQANSDPFVYPTNYPITHNSPISVTMPGASSPNLFLVFKVPATESAKTTWFNTALNNGNFPDSVFQTPTTFGGWTYYYTRVAATMDTTQPFVMS